MFVVLKETPKVPNVISNASLADKHAMNIIRHELQNWGMKYPLS